MNGSISFFFSSFFSIFFLPFFLFFFLFFHFNTHLSLFLFSLNLWRGKGVRYKRCRYKTALIVDYLKNCKLVAFILFTTIHSPTILLCNFCQRRFSDCILTSDEGHKKISRKNHKTQNSFIAKNLKCLRNIMDTTIFSY